MTWLRSGLKEWVALPHGCAQPQGEHVAQTRSLETEPLPRTHPWAVPKPVRRKRGWREQVTHQIAITPTVALGLGSQPDMIEMEVKNHHSRLQRQSSHPSQVSGIGAGTTGQGALKTCKGRKRSKIESQQFQKTLTLPEMHSLK